MTSVPFAYADIVRKFGLVGEFNRQAVLLAAAERDASARKLREANAEIERLRRELAKAKREAA